MRKNSLLIPALLTLFIIINGMQYDARAQSKWSGTLTLTQKLVWEGGKSDRHVEVSFTNALPTLHRNDPTTDLNFTDDKGTGATNYHAEFIVGGKLISTTDCRGAGQTELHEIVIDPEDSSLTIHAIGPACNGQTVELLPGGKTQSYGPDFTDILVSSKASGGVNQTVLTGSYTTVSDVVGMGTLTSTVSWGLWRGPIDAVLIVSPVNYNNWTPSATSDELRKGNAMHINLKVQKRNGGDSPFRVSRFELKLSNTSTEKGTTLNFPLEPSPVQLPDLRLLPDSIAESSEADQSIEINSTDGKTGYFAIGSYDGGGWSTLTAVAVLDGGIRIEGTLLLPTGVKEIPIPKRNANSKIATSWLTANGNPGEMDDKEPLSTKPGDGLTAYEEYRGVISQGGFRRLKPNEKELGITATKGNHTLFAEGVRLFENASRLTVVPFDSAEIAADRKFNRNFGHANVYEQYVLKLENGATTRGAAGENRPTNLTYMIPRQSELVVINVNWIDRFYHLQDSTARADRMQMPYTKSEMLASTVAHEMGHGVNINHHGDPSVLPQNRTAYENSQPPYHIFGTNGFEIPVQNWKYDAALGRRYFEIYGYVGERGNEESGDLSCFMAYTSLYNWSYRTGPDGSLNYYEVPLLPIGKKLCTGKTGMNDLNSRPNSKYFGAATVGNCLGQIKLRD